MERKREAKSTGGSFGRDQYRNQYPGIAQMLVEFFHSFDSVPDTNFIVAGYIKDLEMSQLLFQVKIKDRNIGKIDSNNQGAIWDGKLLYQLVE